MSEKKLTRKWNNSVDVERLFVMEAAVSRTINGSLTLGPGMFLMWKESVLLGDEKYFINFSSCTLYG